MTTPLDAVARAICAESCAYMGEPSCWSLTESEGAEKCPWPNPNCDDPGCMALAAVALAASGAEALEASRDAMQAAGTRGMLEKDELAATVQRRTDRRLDAYGLALMMIREGCDTPAEVARITLKKYGAET